MLLFYFICFIPKYSHKNGLAITHLTFNSNVSSALNGQLGKIHH